MACFRHIINWMGKGRASQGPAGLAGLAGPSVAAPPRRAPLSAAPRTTRAPTGTAGTRTMGRSNACGPTGPEFKIASPELEFEIGALLLPLSPLLGGACQRRSA